jgi:hypothetical protein
MHPLARLLAALGDDVEDAEEGNLPQSSLSVAVSPSLSSSSTSPLVIIYTAGLPVSLLLLNP